MNQRTQRADLHSEEVVDSRDNDVDGCIIPCLCPQVVLEIWKKDISKHHNFVLGKCVQTNNSSGNILVKYWVTLHIVSNLIQTYFK